MRLNVNERVRVELTDQGLYLLRAYEHEHNLTRRSYYGVSCERVYFRFQVWELMAIFGPSRFTESRCDPAFVDNEIIIGDE